MRFVRRAVLSVSVAAAVATSVSGCGGGNDDPGEFSWSRSAAATTNDTAAIPTFTTTTPPVSGPVVLGRADNQYAIGYGTERPELVSLNSLCGNTISDITWTSWGGETATGTGNVCAPAGDPTSGGPTQLTATDLGDCYGVQAYRRLVLASGGSFNTCS
ncbi:hypothetical protein [Gordonia rubripertincta]|uniref:Secreted protein n=1 Tax=Gordonia rubripertincta TaxID=36822 RepID=A0ABT4MYV0_GORRU|nr:hypothetical protein [Gordonia rubripertincta]MCZ4552168.1 hypothetical protein [Gordonia rubripertincta]